MKTIPEKVWLAAVGLIVLYSVYPNGVVSTETVSIDGLEPDSPLSADGVMPTVSDRRVDIPMPGQAAIRIEGWPAFLPQTFAPQKVQASRRLAAGGPVDRIALTRIPEQRPWLLVGAGATPGSELFDGWQLQFTGKEWSLSNGKEDKHLRTANKPARPTIVAHGKERWCVYLLATEAAACQQAEQAGDTAVRAAWAAIRLSSGKRHETE